MAQLTLSGIAKHFGDTQVLHSIDLVVDSGEFIVFVGPSGCGKSTLLRMIAGLESIDAGEMQVDGARFNEVPAAKRGVAMVFQSYALYPHLSVRGNMEYGMRINRVPAPERAARVAKAAEMLKLTDLLDRRPASLSGGQRQRVAIGRAVVRDPQLFLFDEPLSNLDAGLRTGTRVEIMALKRTMPQTTMIYVTHDQVEAMTMADRIVVMNAGRIEQVGRPLDLYHRPANRFVAGFIGSPGMNFLAPAALSGAAAVDLPDECVEVGIRPENFEIAAESAPAEPATLTGEVTLCEHLGELTVVHLVLPDGATLVAKLPGDTQVNTGDQLSLVVKPSRCHLFDASGLAIGPA